MVESLKSLVAGAGGFIGGHLVAELLRRGDSVLAIDCKPESDWYQSHQAAESRGADLSLKEEAVAATRGVDRVFNLAADMGGIGFIEGNKAECMLSVLINTHLLVGCRENDVSRFFYSSSACAYPVGSQDTPEAAALKESDAYPAMPEDGYGWEKLFSERMCRHFMEDFGIETRVARYHNVYGPHGAFEGGREKAPAAICRKVAQSALSGADEIEIWGDGEQTRSFMYIDDCVHGTLAIMDSEFGEPLNLGSDESVTINQLVDLTEGFAGVRLRRNYDLSAPQGVRGRNSDNTLISEVLGWAPGIPLEQGLRDTYSWIAAELAERS